jgi:F-type H+-transporting ATPase subunit b
LDQVLSILNPMTSTIFWSIIVFGILAFVLWKFALKPVDDAVSKRQEEIKQNIDDAEKKKQEAQEILLKQKEEIDKALEKARKVIEDSKAEAETIKRDIEKKAKADSRQMLEEARKEIEREKEKSLEEIRDRIIELSFSTAENLISKSISKKDHKKIIEDSLKEVEKI